MNVVIKGFLMIKDSKDYSDTFLFTDSQAMIPQTSQMGFGPGVFNFGHRRREVV